jgi:hypothetical protein
VRADRIEDQKGWRRKNERGRENGSWVRGGRENVGRRCERLRPHPNAFGLVFTSGLGL